MSVSNSESSDINNTLSASDSESESIDVLSRSLRLARRKLEKEIVESINDHSARPEFWTVFYFNARAEILRNLKEEFFEKISALIEKCNAVDSDQCADISDNCELFRTKIITLWDEFCGDTCIGQ